jgi:hypothetical protein
MRKIAIQLTLFLLLCGEVSNAQLIKSYGFKLALTSRRSRPARQRVNKLTVASWVHIEILNAASRYRESVR